MRVLQCCAHNQDPQQPRKATVHPQGTLNATLDAELAAAQAALSGTTNSLNATITQLAASLAATNANVATLTSQLLQARFI